MSDIFEKASRARLRFDTPRGLVMVEDLWELPLKSNLASRPNLDDIAKDLHKQLKNEDNVSFVDETTSTDTETQLKFDIVKHVIAVKIAENKAKAEEQARAAKKQRLMQIIEQKQDEGLQGKSLEELQAELETL